MNINLNDSELIAAYFADEVSPGERALYLKKLQTDNTFREKAEAYREAWEGASRLRIPAGESVGKRWERLETAIDREMVATNVRRMPHWRYAAAVVLFAMATGLFLWMEAFSPNVHFATGNGERKQIELPDGSLVNLNAGSELTFEYSLFKRKRKVSLKGEGYFEVEKSDRPFEVRAGHSQISVQGTAFNVRYYDSSVDVACTEGKVKVVGRAGGGQLLTRGFAIRAGEDGLSGLYKINTEQIAMWRSGKLYFRETPLAEVFDELERYFNVRLETRDHLKKLTFSGKFDQPELEETLKIICLSAGLDYEIVSEEVIRIQ